MRTTTIFTIQRVGMVLLIKILKTYIQTPALANMREVIQTRTKIRIRSIGQKELQKLLTMATTGTSIRAIKKLELSQKTQKVITQMLNILMNQKIILM